MGRVVAMAACFLALGSVGSALGQDEEGAGDAVSAEEASEIAATASGDVAAVLEAHDHLMRAYAAVDAPGVSALLDPSADLFIFHPRGNLEFGNFPDASRGLEHMFGRVGPSTWSNESSQRVTVRDDVAWYTYYLEMEWGGSTEPMSARGTEIWVRRASGWRLIHGHWSEDPGIPHPE